MAEIKLTSLPIAEDVDYDNTTSGLTAQDVQAALDELNAKVSSRASPGYSFGRSGNVPANSWLYRPGSVPSNKTGVPVSLDNPKIIEIAVGNENVSTFTVEIYEHEGDEVNLTLLTSVNVVASRTGIFGVDVAVTKGRQLAVKTTAGSSKNPGVDLQLKGTS